MPTPSSQEMFRQKIYRKRYLDELVSLIGRPVNIDELGSIELAASIRETGQKFCAQASQHCEIPFTERCSERFMQFVQKLYDANPSPIYIWTPRTNDCGVLLASSLKSIKFNFDFAINDEGILVFLSSDLEDRLLLDFSISPAGDQIMKIETQGENWARVNY